MNAVSASEGQPLLARLAHLIVRRRKIVIAAWIVLTLFGAFSAGQVSKRWFESFSIPGYSSYEANQRTLKAFGTGEQAPLVAVFHSDGDITKEAGIQKAVAAAAAVNPGSRDLVLLLDRREPRLRLEGRAHDLRRDLPAEDADLQLVGAHRRGAGEAQGRTRRRACRRYLTGRDPLYDASTGGSSGGPSVLTEALIGGLGCLVILFFVFGTLPAVLMPIVVAIAAILNTFTLVWILTYITNVSIIVQFLIALVGLGVAIDYALADDLPLPRRAARGRGRRDGARRDDDARRALGDRLGLDRGRRAALDARAAAAVHPLDRDRRPADPDGLGDHGDHAAAGAARDPRPADQQRPPAAEALRRPRPSRGRPVGALGPLRHAPSRGRGDGRPRDRRGARLLRRAAEPERGAGQGLPRQGRRDQRPSGARRRPYLAGRDEAVRGARREQRRPAGGRGQGSAGARHRRRRGAARLAQGPGQPGRGLPRRRRRGQVHARDDQAHRGRR